MARKPKEHKAAKATEVLPDPAELQKAMTNGQIPQPEPGNETKLGGSRRNGRLKIQELPAMRGKGVELITYPDLEEMGDELDDLRSKKSKLAEKITLTEGKALEKMKSLGLTTYRFSDLVMTVVPGADHVKVKSVKVGDDTDHEDED